MIIQFLVLACSYKHKKRCVAGIDLDNKRIARLISNDADSWFAIDKAECYFNARELRPLDVISVDIIEKAPDLGAQTENHYVELPLIKEFIGIASPSHVDPYLESQSIYPFRNKAPFISKYNYNKLSKSLVVVRALNLYFYRSADKTKVDFDLVGRNNDLIRLEKYSVTDPSFCIFDNSSFEEISLEEAYLVLSLPPMQDDEEYCNIFVAGVIRIR